MVFYVQSPNPSFGCVNTLKGLAIVCFSIFHLCSNLVLLFFCSWRVLVAGAPVADWGGVSSWGQGAPRPILPPRHLLDSQTPIRECGPAWGSMSINRSRPVLLWPNTNPWNVEHLVGICMLLLKFLSISRSRHTNSESIIIILKRSNASWNIETEKSDCRAVQDPASPTPMCASDVPRTRPGTHRLDIFAMLSIRKIYGRMGPKKTSSQRQYGVKWIFGRNFFIGSCFSKIPRTVTPVLQYKWKQTCKIETFPNRHISVCLGGFRLSVTLWQASDGQATN